MSDDEQPVDDTDHELSPTIAALLSRADTWDDAPDLEPDVLAAITAEITAEIASEAGPTGTAPISLDTAREGRGSRAIPRWLGVAAAVALVVAGAAVVIQAVQGESPEAAEAVAQTTLIATDLAPGAVATATLEDTPAGLKIVLDVDGLPGAAPDEMYEAWISDGTTRVSAGTFHLRGGDAPIELWAGVADPSFHLLSVTIEPVDGVAESSGQVVLAGEFDLTGD